MAISLVQGWVTTEAGSAVTTLSATFASTPTIGNLVVAVVSFGNGTVSSTAVKDGTPNTYTATTNTPFLNSTDVQGVGIWYWVVTGTPSKTVTATWVTSAQPDIWIAEFSGNLTPIGSVFDTDATQANAAETNVILPSLTPAGAGELIISVIGTAGSTSSANSPWTGVEGSVPASGNFAEYQIKAGTGATPVAYTTTSGANVCLIAAFKAAAVTGVSEGIPSGFLFAPARGPARGLTPTQAYPIPFVGVGSLSGTAISMAGATALPSLNVAPAAQMKTVGEARGAPGLGLAISSRGATDAQGRGAAAAAVAIAARSSVAAKAQLVPSAVLSAAAKFSIISSTFRGAAGLNVHTLATGSSRSQSRGGATLQVIAQAIASSGVRVRTSALLGIGSLAQVGTRAFSRLGLGTALLSGAARSNVITSARGAMTAAGVLAASGVVKSVSVFRGTASLIGGLSATGSSASKATGAALLSLASLGRISSAVRVFGAQALRVSAQTVLSSASKARAGATLGVASAAVSRPVSLIRGNLAAIGSFLAGTGQSKSQFTASALPGLMTSSVARMGTATQARGASSVNISAAGVLVTVSQILQTGLPAPPPVPPATALDLGGHLPRRYTASQWAQITGWLKARRDKRKEEEAKAKAAVQVAKLAIAALDETEEVSGSPVKAPRRPLPLSTKARRKLREALSPPSPSVIALAVTTAAVIQRGPSFAERRAQLKAEWEGILAAHEAAIEEEDEEAIVHLFMHIINGE